MLLTDDFQVSRLDVSMTYFQRLNGIRRDLGWVPTKWGYKNNCEQRGCGPLTRRLSLTSFMNLVGIPYVWGIIKIGSL